jgi:hypothetical protein
MIFCKITGHINEANQKTEPFIVRILPATFILMLLKKPWEGKEDNNITKNCV